MKKSGLIIMLLSSMLLFSNQLLAQAFEGTGSKQLLMGIGMNHHRGFFSQNGKGIEGTYSPIAGGLNLEMEFGIHDYVGLGIFVGVEGFGNIRGGELRTTYMGSYYGSYYYTNYNGSNYWGIAVPIGFQANFHFLQLIADKTGKTFADKLDVYAGLSVGSGAMFVFPTPAYKNSVYQNSTEFPAFVKNSDLNDVGLMLYGGGQVGIRFYPASNFGIYAEVGYGKSIVQGGICFKM